MVNSQMVEPFEVLSNLLPDAGLRRRVEAGQHRLASAKTMHITSKAGTDVTYRLGDYPVLTEYGMHGRAFLGNVLFSTGPDVEPGGTNDTEYHLDIPLRGANLSLDGEVIVESGSPGATRYGRGGPVTDRP